MTNAKHITSSAAAEILGVSQRTAIRWADEGVLPVADKVPGRNGARLFEESAVRAIAAERITEQREALDQRLAAMGGAA